MIRIAIIEFSYHAELLNSLGDLFYESEIALHFFVSPNVHQSMSEEVIRNFSCTIIPDKTSLGLYFQSINAELNAFDLLVFNTVADHYSAFKNLKLQVPTILRIHNVHATFAPFTHLNFDFSPYFIWKAASYLFRRQVLHFDWFYQFSFLKKVNYFSFLSADIQTYAQKWVDPARIAPSLPAEMCKIDFDHQLISTDTEVFRLVVPGEINRRKRDYHLLYQALNLAVREFKRPIQVTLLGKPRDRYGTQILALYQQLASEKIDVQTYPGRVPETEFERIMRAADLIVAPVKLKTSYAIYAEYYGLTKISGAQSDAIRYGKALLVPQELKVDERLKPLVWKYQDKNDLVQQLKTLINTEILSARLTAQREALSHFSKVKLLPQITQELKTFLAIARP